MISGKTIICFASGWDYHPTSKHHVMRQLALQNRVIWINWHASRRPNAGLADLRCILSKLSEIRRGPRRVSDAITVITPGQLPVPGSSLARRLNTALVRRAVRRALSELPPAPVQIWSFAPDVADLVGSFGEELVLYYCVDAFGEFPGYDRALTERRERELLDRSDVVIATSPPLYEGQSRRHPNVHFVQHGVNHAHLARALAAEPVPADLASLPKPILGFVGMIGEWVDLNLVAGLARQRPDASIVLIGPETTGRGPCAGLPNVHWLGSRSHDMLPDYLRGFDVGLIPFRHVPLTHNANPIKLYEYLAAGVPVVSTTIPAVRAIPNSVWLADEVPEFAVACGRAARNDTPAARLARSQSMLAEAWPTRLEQLSGIVNEALARRGSPAPLRAPRAPAPLMQPVAGGPCRA